MAGALLLPRAAVVRAAHAGLDAAGIAELYGTTDEMARFRINATGAAIQARRGGLPSSSPAATHSA